MYIRRRSLVLAFITLLLNAPALAATESHPLQSPVGRVILEVKGAIEKTSNGTSALFDIAELEKLGTAEISTESPWTDGKPVFQGVPISALADHVGATGSQVRFVALDDYSVTIPISDFAAYEPILATRRDGELMRIRDKGPIWVIYPWSDFPDTQNEEYYAKAIWQVYQMIFE